MSPTHGAPFRGFRDHEESPFFRAPGLTPEQTWDVSINRLADILETLGPLADAGPIEFSPALLRSWHRQIFEEMFPDDAGRLRWRRGRDPEHVYFDAIIGTHQTRRLRRYRGTSPRKLHRRLARSVRSSTPRPRTFALPRPSSVTTPSTRRHGCTSRSCEPTRSSTATSEARPQHWTPRC
jgi:hypothetical protein